MLFLIDYDRSTQKIVSMRTFESSERAAAVDARFALELEQHASETVREVVLLEAESEEVIRHTHGRYFYTIAELIDQCFDRLDRQKK
jgi:hypothetical protein